MAIESIQKWRGLKSLVHEAVDWTADLVDLGHESTMRSVTRISDRIRPLRKPVRFVDDVRRFATRGVLTTIKAVNRAVEVVSDAAFDGVECASHELPPAAPEEAAALRSDVARTGAWIADGALGVVNAAVGDRLSESHDGLDQSMVFRVNDRYVEPDREMLRAALPDPRPRVVLLVHGLAMTERSWSLGAEAYHGQSGLNFGSLLERDLGFTPMFLRYNTGRRISQNGRRLAAELGRLIEAYPVPIEDLTLIGHSMGGLVLRSACHYGATAEQDWTSRVRRVFCLGSPHRGAPLAKLGHALTGALDGVDLPATKIIARILAVRSAGIRDLRHGAVVDEDWLLPETGAQRDVTWLPHARHYFVSATVTEDPDHVVGRLVGDLLVRVPSATGPAVKKSSFNIHVSRYGGVLHHQIQNHPQVYEQLRRACCDLPRLSSASSLQ